MDYRQEAEKLKDEYANAACGVQLGWCDTKKCPLWGDRRGRFDGLCVAETYLDADAIIESYERDIQHLQWKIDAMRNKIKNLESFKKQFEEYLEGKK